MNAESFTTKTSFMKQFKVRIMTCSKAGAKSTNWIVDQIIYRCRFEVGVVNKVISDIINILDLQ